MVTKKIIDPLKIKLRSTELLCIIKKIKSPILVIDSTDNKDYNFNYYLEVIKKGEMVSFVDVGDYILLASMSNSPTFECSDEQTYVILKENSVGLVVSKENLMLN